MSGRLDRLLRPKSIAVVGGGFWGANVVEQCRKIGFCGEIWPVHPNRAELGAVSAFRDIAALPGAPDAAFVGVNSAATVAVVAELAARGAGGAVCFASGFLEAAQETGDGAARQAALLDAAGEMPILGPNCYGLVNYLDRAVLWPDQHGGRPVERGVAIVTQSSNIAINLTMQQRGLPIAYVVTAGNQAQLGLSEIGQAVLTDPRVTALGLHIEGIDGIRRFEALAATARALGKPIVALKVGRSDQARAATVSHTASLAGSDAGAEALFHRLGIGQVRSLAGFLEALKLLHVAGSLASGRIASLSCSGGEASLMADAVLGTRLSYPPLEASQIEALGAVLGPKVALANPLDYHTYIWGDEEALAATYTAAFKGDLAMGLVVVDFPREDRCSAEAWEPVIRAAKRAKEASGRPVALLSSLPETMPEAVAERVMDLGLVPFSGLTEAMEAMDVAAWLGQGRPEPAPLLLPKASREARTLTEAEAKAALAAHGLRVPKSERGGASDIAEAADRIGYPVVLKGEGIAHKTEAGAVALGLSHKAAVRQAAETMPSETFLVEEMISGTVAELLVGVVRDQAHGYVLTLAAGGTLTELLADRVSLLVPASRAAVAEALHRLKLARLIDGYRGQPGANRAAILDAVMAVQSYVAAHHPDEVEINPLLCGPETAIAADALIKIGDLDD